MENPHLSDVDQKQSRLKKLRAFLFLYSVLFAVGVVFLTPFIIVHHLRKKKSLRHLLERAKAPFSSYGRTKNGPCIWVHAVSMGETRAIAPLLKRMKKERPDIEIVVSSITKTGHQEAKKALDFADHWLLFPFDFKWQVRPLLRRFKPDLVILSETDFWWNFLYSAKIRGAKIVLVNGKMSPRSFSLWKRLGLGRFFFSLFDFALVQNISYQEYFSKVGIPLDKICVTGNTKLDFPPPFLKEDQRGIFEKKWGIEKEDRVVVIGSTHEGEEKELCKILAEVKKKIPRLKVLLVPRHPERFEKARQITSGYPFVTLIAEMGVLSLAYRLGSLAVVAGSFVPGIGGHNLIEPVLADVPVFFGPYTESQKDLKKLVLDFKAGIECSFDNLGSHIEEFFKNKEIQENLKKGATSLKHRPFSATEISFKQVRKMIKKKLNAFLVAKK